MFFSYIITRSLLPEKMMNRCSNSTFNLGVAKTVLKVIKCNIKYHLLYHVYQKSLFKLMNYVCETKFSC